MTDEEWLNLKLIALTIASDCNCDFHMSMGGKDSFGISGYPVELAKAKEALIFINSNLNGVRVFETPMYGASGGMSRLAWSRG